MHGKRIGLLALLALLLTPAAHAATWEQRPGTVLAPTQEWEGNVTQEPTVLAARGKLHMFYSGGFHKCLMGHAVSDDGIQWTKQPGPVLGGGAGGELLNACHSHVYFRHGWFYALYSPDSDWQRDPNLRLASSRDGQTWRRHDRIILAPGDWDLAIVNSFVVHTPGKVTVMYESLNAFGLWEMAVASGPNIFNLTKHPEGQMTSLYRNGMYGGPWLTRENGAWRLYFHASRSGENLPTDIYTATSSDLHNWEVQDSPVVARTQDWQVDQVADASMVVWRKQRLLYFSGLDNTEPGTARIGIATG